MKRCTRCGTEKPRSEFYAARGPKSNKDGLYAKCKGCQKEVALAAYYKNGPKDPERNREAQRRFRERHPGKDAEYGRKWREKNPERTHKLAYARHKRHRTTKPERHIASEMKRRARTQTITRMDEQYIAILRGDPCAYCGSYGKTVDHVEPLHFGGGVGWDNLTAACRSCNTSKRIESLLSFLLRAATPVLK